MILRLLLLLAAFSSVAQARQMEVWVRPAAPTVGDPITLTFPDAAAGGVALEASDAYEIVSSGGNSVVIRSFLPGMLEIGAIRIATGEETFVARDLDIAILSVLEEGDTLQPAPLRPPAPLPENRAAWVSLALAAAAAVALWALVYIRRPHERAAEPAVPTVRPSVELIRALEQAATLPPARSRIAIGEATRTFLARVDRAWGRELTSRELRRTLRRAGVREEYRASIDTILLEADLEKFSPKGAPEIETRQLIESARRLAELEKGEGRGARGERREAGQDEVILRSAQRDEGSPDAQTAPLDTPPDERPRNEGEPR